MRRLLGLGLALALVLAAVPGASGAGKPLAIYAIGIQTAELNADFAEPGNNVLAGFVETGSLEPACLVSLSYTNVAAYIRAIQCAPWQIERDGRLMNGVFLRVTVDAGLPDDAALVLNYYQEHLVTAPGPIPCDGDC
jgi:hypothetical protein